MNLKEVTALLGWKREEIKTAIERGVELPKSKNRITLKASPVENDYDIAESDLDTFIDAFESEEPGRHPPIGVRRILLLEANHKCAVCRDSTPVFQFHHMVEFSNLKHYDPNLMLAVCGSCHNKMTIGQIDYQTQKMYKAKLRERKQPFDDFPARFSWDDLKEIVGALHSNIVVLATPGNSKYDFSHIDIERKNELNRLGENYFAIMQEHHEPYFRRIEEFLKNPINAKIADLYHEIVDELRSKIAVDRGGFENFEAILMLIFDSAKDNHELNSRRSTLNVLLSFMYFQCDIGRKADDSPNKVS